MNCSSKLQFCCEVNSDDGERCEPGDLCGADPEMGGVLLPVDEADCGPESGALPKLDSAIEVMAAADGGLAADPGNPAGRPGKPGGRLFRRCERGEVRYSLRKASRPARPMGVGSLRPKLPLLPLLSRSALSLRLCAFSSRSISSRSSRS